RSEAARPETDHRAEMASEAKAAGERAEAKGLTGAMPASPSAQKLLNEEGMDAGDIAGSGKRGQVLKEDVLAAIANPPKAAENKPVEAEAPKPAPAAEAPKPAQAPRAPTPAGDAGREERVRMTRLRQTIARRLKDAQNTAAMLTTFNE